MNRVSDGWRIGGLLSILWVGCALALVGPTVAGAAEDGRATGGVRVRTGAGRPLEYTGVNLAGGEFGPMKDGVQRVYGKHYIFPAASELNYFAGQGVNIIRLPFRWEDLQPVLCEALAAPVLDRVKKVVAEAKSRGVVTILDPHNYARYRGKTIGSPEVPHAAFADFWSRVATEFRNDPRIWLGLMNEPHGMPSEQWLEAANSGIAAIRHTGATNMILVPGNAWTGAHSWISSKNAEVMLKVVDPLDHYVFEVHQYLDKDSSGTKPEAVSATIGRERLQKFTDWCRTHHRRGFLGEMAAADNAASAQAMEDMLTFMENNRDVWVGFTWWAAGPWWGDYMFSLAPKQGQDRPQMKVLRPHFQTKSAGWAK